MRVKYPVVLILFLLQPSKNFGSEAKLLDPERIWSQTPGKGETAAKYPDTNDYHQQPFCGNQALGKYYYSDTSNKDYKATCFCGSEAISGFEMIFGKVFCCVSPGDPCYQIGGLHVSCPTGKKHLKTTPCHSQCYNSYNQSEFLWMTSASLYCHEEDLCLPVQEMCSGVCNTEGELCSFDVRCPGHGYDDVVEAGGWPKYTLQSLGGKVTGNHEYCFTVNNDGSYDTISRMDEDKVTTKNVKLFEYEDLKTCKHKDGGQGISCKEGCGQNIVWCTGIGLVCTTLEGPVGVDNVDLCQNNTFWLNRSCDWYDDNGLNSVGLRCTGETKHCILPWYNKLDAYPTVLTECFDESDQAFPINTTCSDFNHQFLETYKKVWCGEGGTGLRCDNLEEYFINQKVDKRIRDPHRCEESCITTGADCLACHHEDYFHCQTTGICIHHSNVCDGHPHPQCGGDDENMYDCYQTYVKKRIVKNYATFICDSVMYPEMKTMAVVCDDIIECANNQDERSCDGPKNNTVPYILTCFIGMFYLVLKLVWWFHQRHQDMDDEDDDNNIPMEELVSTANQEANAVGPSKESIRYQLALEQLDRVLEINKKITGYVSSDSENEI